MTTPAAAPAGLTTAKAPDIEAAQARDELYIEQSDEPLLVVVNDVKRCFDEVRRLARWMQDGTLNTVARGEPVISEADLRRFLEAGH
jgi:hypothetical protein